MRHVVCVAPRGRAPAAQGFASTDDGALLVLPMKRASSPPSAPRGFKGPGRPAVKGRVDVVG